MRTRDIFLLVLIVLSAFLIRVYRIADTPVNLAWDEVTSGYNAYSILKTGRDEFGKPLPVLFESFNDFKHPGLIYSIVPSIGIFGPTTFAVRFPSVIYGVLTVLVIFAFVIRLTKSARVALISAFLLALSPWHIQVSRVAFEQIGMIFFVVLGAWAFMRGVANPRMLLLSAVNFALSFYFYYSVRIFVPLLLLSLIGIYWGQLRRCKLWLTVAGLAGLLVLAPLAINVASPKGIERASKVSIFTDAGINLAQREWRAEHRAGLAGAVFHQKFITWVRAQVEGYIDHFSLPFLFFDNEQVGRHAPRMMGMMYALELPFLLLGLYEIVRRRAKSDLVLLAWLLIAPIPASLAVPTPHALRAILMVIPLAIITALGLVKALSAVKRVFSAGLLMAVYFVVLIWSIGFYLDNYYLHSSKLSARDWADGHRQLFEFLAPRHNGYERIAMTGYHWRPYIFSLFYLQTDPSEWFARSGGVNHARFGTWYYGISPWDQQDPYYKPDFDWEELIASHNTLVILSAEEATKLLDEKRVRGKYKSLTTIYAANNEKVFEVVERL